MNITDIGIIALIIVLIGSQFFQLRIMARLIQESAMHLDHNIAEAIKTTVENLPDALREQIIPEIEPVNPIQALIGQMIAERMNPPITAQVLPGRSEDGKFVKDT